MKTRALFASLVASSLLLAGCGAAQPPAAVSMPKTSKATVVGTGTYEAQGVPANQVKPAATTPTGQYQGTTGGSTTSTGGSTVTNGGSTASTPAGKLEATIVSEKNGTLFGMGKYKASVEVSNPTGQRLTGTVTIMFMNGEKESKTGPVSRPVDVPANGSITLDFEDKNWSTDAAEVEVTTDAAPLTGLTAAVTSKKNGVVFGMGKFKATVEIANPTAATKSGTVTVTFLNKGNPVEGGVVEEQVTLDAGEKTTLTFENKKWTTDDVEVEVK